MTQSPSIWFNRQGYLQGVFWIIMVALISCSNDICMRYLGKGLPSMEIAFFRFFFATLVLMPFMLVKGIDAFKTAHPVLHFLRATMGFGAVACWCYGVGQVPLGIVSTIALTVPLFVLPMAFILLRENVGWQRALATLAGFVGIIIVLYPDLQKVDLTSGAILSLGSVVLVIAAVLFAFSDILNKFMISKESPLTMLFYFALGTTIAGFIPAAMVWQTPTMHDFVFLFLLGIGGNLILFCLLKAFAAVDVSALAPFRYTELIFANIFGFVLFAEIPYLNAYMGMAIIVPSTFAIAYYETHQRLKISKAEKAERLRQEEQVA